MRGKYEAKPKPRRRISDFLYQRNWKWITAILSIFVVVGTVAALVLPGVTQGSTGSGVVLTEEEQRAVDDTIFLIDSLPDLAEIQKHLTNLAGSELPSTGCMGTTLFTTIGALLMLCTAVVLITRKRVGAMN